MRYNKIPNDNQNNNKPNINEINNNKGNEKIKNNIKLNNLVETMKKYFLFEKNMSEKSKKPEVYFNTGFLIEKKIIDKWKTNMSYEENEIKAFLSNKNVINNNDIKIQSINDFTHDDQFEIFTKKNSMVLIDKALYLLMNNLKENNENEIQYKIRNNQISFDFNNLKHFYLKSNIVKF